LGFTNHYANHYALLAKVSKSAKRSRLLERNEIFDSISSLYFPFVPSFLPSITAQQSARSCRGRSRSCRSPCPRTYICIEVCMFGIDPCKLRTAACLRTEQCKRTNSHQSCSLAESFAPPSVRARPRSPAQSRTELGTTDRQPEEICINLYLYSILYDSI